MMTKIERTLGRGLTVAELIEELQQFEMDARVLFTCDYGDHCHTRQALPIERISPLEDEECIEESGYSKSGLAIGDYDEGNYEDGPGESKVRPSVVILS